MADLKNLALTGGGGSRYSGDEQVQFIPGGSHQVTIKSPPPSLHLENLNNAVLRYIFLNKDGILKNKHLICWIGISIHVCGKKFVYYVLKNNRKL